MRIKLYCTAILLLPVLLAAASSLETFAGRKVLRIDIEGHRTTREHTIRRELHTTTGQAFDPERWRADLQRLDNLDIFSSLNSNVQATENGIILVLRMREMPPAVPYVSYNVTDEDGWSFGPALKAVNLLGRDILVAGYALFGGKTTFLLDLNYPWIAGNHLSLDLDIGRIERENTLDGFRETSFEFSPWVGAYLGERGRAAVGFSYFRVDSDRPGHTLQTNGRDQLFQAGLRLGYDSRDAWGDPHRGWLNEIEIQKTGGPLPGDGDYWTTHLDLRRFQPLPSEQTLVLAGLLSLQSGEVGHNLPEYMDFHLGGANTIRGYQIDELGSTLFGKNQLIGTLEYRFPLLANREYILMGLAADIGLSGAFFADTGLAWSHRRDFAGDRLQTGVGLGLRLLLPAVDMTRLDIGYSPSGGWQIHFASFAKMRAQRARLR
ncbi:MAG TPA: hypothetical protein EYG11_02495 [Candidatus Latescibacteria bacterium]|nr:hypothetical protein [Candidatus Handelsmanbacteria bacterium]HIL07548.1 hypothetical protein [Candidatus Latescibacterota bacterium]